MSFKLSAIAVAILSVSSVSYAFAEDSSTNENTDSDQIEVITVTGEFRDININKSSSTVSLLSEEDIKRQNAQNLEEIIALTPNVNLSSGSQRARYYQIRGIGERSQFREPINPSVGVIIDDVDFTGIGSISSMFDVQQTEVFRGPQGTRFGSNALAGIINIKTNAPTNFFEGSVKALVGNYGSQGLGFVASGPASESINYRFAAEQYSSDGFIDNLYSGASDTNNRDELSIRGKLAIDASEHLSINLTAMYFDFDNGYDAFSLDNTRETYSDQPGFDIQETSALAANFDYSGLDAANIKIVASIASSDLAYGYDEDWAFGDYDWETGDCITPTGCLADAWGYSSTDHYFRKKNTETLEIRATSKEGQEIFDGTTEWVAGIYFKNDDSELNRIYTWDADFHSTFKTNTIAVYSELSTKLSDDLTLTTGIRVENRNAKYVNSTDYKASPSDSMFGGKAVLNYELSETSIVFGSINRGYKAGGVNTDGTLLDTQREFDPEYLWNYELGYKATYFDNAVYLRAALFLMDREDVQVKISYQLPDSTEFVEFLDNASKGTNQGFELESGWKVSQDLEFYGSLGILDTEYGSFSYDTEDGPVSLSGREQAHAPSYQVNLGTKYFLSEAWLLNFSIEGKDEFYFSDSHNQKSDAVTLANLSVSYTQENWDLTFWGRNITDEEYQTRGFYFGNDPRDFYTAKPYYQLGEPAVYGVTANYYF
jgi:iron complex outermembrane recepter protein